METLDDSLLEDMSLGQAGCQRSANWTREEEDTLMNSIEKRAQGIPTKFGGPAGASKGTKDILWREVADAVNRYINMNTGSVSVCYF